MVERTKIIEGLVERTKTDITFVDNGSISIESLLQVKTERGRKKLDTKDCHCLLDMETW